jgi:hypothetical protein
MIKPTYVNIIHSVKPKSNFWTHLFKHAIDTGATLSAKWRNNCKSDKNKDRNDNGIIAYLSLDNILTETVSLVAK